MGQGQPKYRRSSSQKRMHREASYKFTPVTIVECPRCHEPKIPHRVCLHCGYYRDMEVIAMKEPEAKTKKT
ncbi:50S ribosomal protein L32 [Candidatus Acetothermia bacterium]|nr:50S ribosomal protein L32 [Candidatus Acetothermia bacterium]MCI2431065.1 50S ribosomal protein L32 [Candidatus Acetothermia bacterium]MCI2435689.1 50S ribosomal protein L32 [Candidatus Acetothermia bacterium]